MAFLNALAIPPNRPEELQAIRPEKILDAAERQIKQMMKSLATGVFIDNIRVAAERKAQMEPGKIYMYRFDWEIPRYRNIYGAMHTVDVLFVFGNIKQVWQWFDSEPGAEVLRLAEEMSEL